ncbi:MAG: phosphoribosyltransferase family protein [Acidimicrobiales bacterium]
MQFANRIEAGRRLAARLEYLRGKSPVVLGLPRGGVPVALEVAEALEAPLDVIVVRKLGVPFQPELGMGAIGEDGVRVLNAEVIGLAGVSSEELAAVERRERAELDRRALRFRGGAPRVPLDGRTVIVVDDGIATGSTARAACQVARAHGAAHVVLAAPVAPPDWTRRLEGDADEFVCVDTPEPFFGVGQFYADFAQTTDEEVIDCLQRGRPPVVAVAETGQADDPPVRDEEIAVQVGPVRLGGHLTVPEEATGVVVFAHGSGSSRHSPRNRYVATVLNQAGLATLLFDLLSPSEEHDRANVFDVELLARRLGQVTDWLRAQPETRDLPVGYFGASTGAAAALWAAAEPHAQIAAVVSRGGRPDLAGPVLGSVTAPTLLIVGGQDHVVLDLNRQAQAQLRCENSLAVVPGATHLFEEAGTLQAAAELGREWFTDHLGNRARPGAPKGVGLGQEPR